MQIIKSCNALIHVFILTYAGTNLPESLAPIKTLTSLTLNIHCESKSDYAIGQLIKNNVLEQIE